MVAVGVLRRVGATARTAWALFLRELSVFGVVGLVNLGVDVALFNLCSQVLGIDPLLSKVIATTVSVTSAYFMHRHWTFAHRARTRFRREYLLFFGLNAVALVFGLAVLAVARYGLGVDGVVGLNVANLLGIGLGTAFRFWSYKRWVFLAQPEDEPEPLVRA